MADNMTLRPAFNGFNRQDVLACIEQLNNNHKAKVQSLEAQLRQLREENARLQAQLEDSQTAAAEPCDIGAQELEAYRRAERMEREARERAEETQACAERTMQESQEYAERIQREAQEYAERIQREAQERATLVSQQTESALKEVTKVVDQSAERVSQLMAAWTEAVAQTREELLSAAEAVNNIPKE